MKKRILLEDGDIPEVVRIDAARAEMDALQQQIDDLPDGELFCELGNHSPKWMVKDDSGLHYLPKRHRKLAVDLAFKKYLELRMDSLEMQCETLRQSVLDGERLAKRVKNFYDPQRDYMNLLKDSPDFLPTRWARWAAEPYRHSSRYEENLKHDTKKGDLVRSKSEVLIANALFDAGVPYRYEDALETDTGTIYPDFKCVNVRDGKIRYWEHLGMMDVPDYVDSFHSKLHIYLKEGILPGRQLLFTAETKDAPLKQSEVTAVIKHYLL